MRRSSRALILLLTAAMTSQLAACGTLFYPDRRGQISGQIDPVVAGMDAIGVLFFVLPGLIAFAIDFASGAIYMPQGRYTVAPSLLQQTLNADGSVNRLKLKQLLKQQLALELDLASPQLQIQPLAAEQWAALRGFWEA